MDGHIQSLILFDYPDKLCEVSQTRSESLEVVRFIHLSMLDRKILKCRLTWASVFYEVIVFLDLFAFAFFATFLLR